MAKMNVKEHLMTTLKPIYSKLCSWSRNQEVLPPGPPLLAAGYAFCAKPHQTRPNYTTMYANDQAFS